MFRILKSKFPLTQPLDGEQVLGGKEDALALPFTQRVSQVAACHYTPLPGLHASWC